MVFKNGDEFWLRSCFWGEVYELREFLGIRDWWDEFVVCDVFLFFLLLLLEFGARFFKA